MWATTLSFPQREWYLKDISRRAIRGSMIMACYERTQAEGDYLVQFVWFGEILNSYMLSPYAYHGLRNSHRQFAASGPAKYRDVDNLELPVPSSFARLLNQSRNPDGPALIALGKAIQQPIVCIPKSP